MRSTRSDEWFRMLFGFDESFGSRARYLDTRANFRVEPSPYNRGHLSLRSLRNRELFEIGKFSTPSLSTLRSKVGASSLSSSNSSSSFSSSATSSPASTLKFEHIVTGDCLDMHALNPRATFQAASQFNCLEFPSASSTPEDGVTSYASDPTQGPACALACAAGTVYRNYFTNLTPNGQEGQTSDVQIDNLSDLHEAIANVDCRRNRRGGWGGDTPEFWEVRNGYTFSTEKKLNELDEILSSLSFDLRDEIVSAVKIGVHDDVGVTFRSRFQPVVSNDQATPPPLVTQCYCSALSCAYSGVPNESWESLATIVLDAAYEATLLAAVLNSLRPGGSNVVFLTFLGGGVFGNDPRWIANAIGRALAIVSLRDRAVLDVKICHHRRINESMVTNIQSTYERFMWG